jgi:hypothetical protein
MKKASVYNASAVAPDPSEKKIRLGAMFGMRLA